MNGSLATQSHRLAVAFALTLVGALCLTTPAADLPRLASGIHFQRTNLVVRWKAPSHPWPKALWVYTVSPTRFSPTVISNLMAIGSFTEKDKKDYGTSGMVFAPPDGSRNLRISFPEGSVEYWSTRGYGPTNLARDVPRRDQLFDLTAELLPKLGISLSEISEASGTGKPKMSFIESPMQYFLGNSVITNVESSGVRFSRALDGVELGGDGGNGEIDFGEHGRVTTISLSWRTMERHKLCATATPGTLMKWLREGRAVHQPVIGESGNEITIDWAKVKSLTVRKAQPYYWGEVYPIGARPAFPSLLRPFAALLATTDTGTARLDLAIQCPILDETKGTGVSK